MMKLFTIGYEGSAIDAFVVTLALAGVTEVLDIRDVPISRKKGFSKSALSQTLDTAGIGYSHLKSLGDPKDGRDAAKRGDFQTFRAIFRKHLATKSAQEALEAVAAIARVKPVALLCYERDPKNCHRSIVASAVVERAELPMTIQHLGVNMKPTSLHKDRAIVA